MFVIHTRSPLYVGCAHTAVTNPAQIGLVSQEPLLFSGSILDNIMYGKPDATTAEVKTGTRPCGRTCFRIIGKPMLNPELHHTPTSQASTTEHTCAGFMHTYWLQLSILYHTSHLSQLPSIDS